MQVLQLRGQGIYPWRRKIWVAPPLEAAGRAIADAFGKLKAEGEAGAEQLLWLASLVREPRPSLVERRDSWYVLNDVSALLVESAVVLVYYCGKLAVAQIGDAPRRVCLAVNADRRWQDSMASIATLLAYADVHPLLWEAGTAMEKYRIFSTRQWGNYPHGWAEVFSRAGLDPQRFIRREDECGCTNEMCGHNSHDPSAPVWEVSFPDEWFVYVSDCFVSEREESVTYELCALRKVRGSEEWHAAFVEETSYRFFHGHSRVPFRERRVAPYRLDTEAKLGRFFAKLLWHAYRVEVG